MGRLALNEFLTDSRRSASIFRNFEPASDSRTETNEGGAEPSLDAHGLVCLSCGGPMRSGTLVAEKELTIVFADNQEERFVRVNACSACGQLSLVADYKIDVQP